MVEYLPGEEADGLGLCDESWRGGGRVHEIPELHTQCSQIWNSIQKAKKILGYLQLVIFLYTLQHNGLCLQRSKLLFKGCTIYW